MLCVCVCVFARVNEFYEENKNNEDSFFLPAPRLLAFCKRERERERERNREKERVCFAFCERTKLFLFFYSRAQVLCFLGRKKQRRAWVCERTRAQKKNKKKRERVKRKRKNFTRHKQKALVQRETCFLLSPCDQR